MSKQEQIERFENLVEQTKRTLDILVLKLTGVHQIISIITKSIADTYANGLSNDDLPFENLDKAHQESKSILSRIQSEKGLLKAYELTLKILKEENV